MNDTPTTKDACLRGGAFHFDRYINGTLMAEGVCIEKQTDLSSAMKEASRLASRGPNGEVPVLVYASLSIQPLVSGADLAVLAHYEAMRLVINGLWGSHEISDEARVCLLDTLPRDGIVPRTDRLKADFEILFAVARKETLLPGQRDALKRIHDALAGRVSPVKEE